MNQPFFNFKKKLDYNLKTSPFSSLTSQFLILKCYPSTYLNNLMTDKYSKGELKKGKEKLHYPKGE